MSMFCYQCQEASGGTGCVLRGVCGKQPETSALQDLLVHRLKQLCEAAVRSQGEQAVGPFVAQALFATITNGNFDDERFSELIEQSVALHRSLATDLPVELPAERDAWPPVAASVGVLAEGDEDKRSLIELIVYGLKGVAAYATHAGVLGHTDPELWSFLVGTLATVAKPAATDRLIELVDQTGAYAVRTMELLDRANTSRYGSPEITEVNIGVGSRPGILVSGHDLLDLEHLLEQTAGKGVDVYTHGEMLPAHYYPAFKRHSHFVGNYGGSWWRQHKEFDSFRGAILMTTNCITPVRGSYQDRIFTTGMAGYPGVAHIPDPSVEGEAKDFSAVIERALACEAPVEIESGTIVGGFAHAQVVALADRIVEAVGSGAIKRFVVMAGCDGRQGVRSYFTEVAEALPDDAVILTAGCAKYRYNKLNLGDIGGIPRVLDAGQCNDSYSLAVVALKLKEILGAADVNDLPISFDLAWYEQKAVAVLLALLHLGFKGIRLGPTLPAFLSPRVAEILVESYGIKPVGEVGEDVAAMMAGA